MAKVRRNLVAKRNQIQKMDNEPRAYKPTPKVPKGYIRVSGDIYTGEDLVIKDFKTKAVYRWMRKTELFEEIDSWVKEVTKKGMKSTSLEEKEKCNEFIRDCGKLKGRIYLKEGAFLSETKKEIIF